MLIFCDSLNRIKLYELCKELSSVLGCCFVKFPTEDGELYFTKKCMNLVYTPLTFSITIASLLEFMDCDNDTVIMSQFSLIPFSFLSGEVKMCSINSIMNFFIKKIRYCSHRFVLLESNNVSRGVDDNGFARKFLNKIMFSSLCTIKLESDLNIVECIKKVTNSIYNIGV